MLPNRDRRSRCTGFAGGELKQGDIQVVQNFACAADLAEFDPAELLAPFYTAVISPPKVSAKPCAEAQSSCITVIKRQQRYVAEAITEEAYGTRPLEVALVLRKRRLPSSVLLMP